jgi:hypothetical protein
MLSALTISPLRTFDNLIASLDFPDAVGPASKTIVGFRSME